ncbi:MAG: stage 0 sporulation family protein [Candidatus Izemoplasmatales bacterium]|jgi:cell fate regulator YaaT (PSP1 superfamily)|nr:stage 0 sporulation family protein [Candidatus Izemoplasmatales bacterium]
MPHTVVAIQFDYLGKKYYFSTNKIDLHKKDFVVVETIRGLELGEVVSDVMEITDQEIVSPLKPILRLASFEDIKTHKENIEKEPYVLEKTSEYVRQNDLDMKLLNCEYTLDRSKLIIYFTAEGRVDFRELVRDLANEFHVRIELRQVGARDGAKVIGGIGPCGRQTCCTTFLREFEPVSIKMAKNQNLSLNPSNISGICGKLLCCIRYEDENYRDFKKQMPNINSLVWTLDGRGKVVDINYSMQSASVQFKDGTTKEYDINEIADTKEELSDDISVLSNLED